MAKLNVLQSQAGDDSGAAASPLGNLKLSRREFAKHTGMLAALLGAASCGAEAVDVVVQKRLHEMSHDELKAFLEKLERRYKARFNRDVEVRATPPIEGVKFAYALDLSRCIGCRRCVHACVKENNQSRPSPEASHNNPIQWIKVLEMEKDKGIDLTDANPYYNPDLVPRPGHFYMPVQCQQCEDPPCTKVCPVQATWSEPDGIVVIDYEWCIGCRYCMVACPYGARRFNWGTPNLPADELNPNTHVLGNRPRDKGVVEKCTFCIQRTRAGRYPACVEICPVGARKFGNMLDPESEIRAVLETKRVFILKEDLNTHPKFFYFFGL
jgi:molybdopterin-containing oxidoreductase family iron-sulfur binding subunit